MTVSFTIPGRLPGTNDYTRAERSHWSKGAKMKQEAEERVMWCIRLGLRGMRINEPVRVAYRWYEPNQKRDMDNISSFGRKVIQDSLVKMHTLANDGWGYIVGFSDEFFVDAENPRIEVQLTTITEQK